MHNRSKRVLLYGAASFVLSGIGVAWVRTPTDADVYTLLEKIADFYDQQVEAEVKGLTSMIEPIMIAIMGVIVGGIVLAVFLPIFKLQEKLSGG